MIGQAYMSIPLSSNPVNEFQHQTKPGSLCLLQSSPWDRHEPSPKTSVWAQRKACVTCSWARRCAVFCTSTTFLSSTAIVFVFALNISSTGYGTQLQTKSIVMKTLQCFTSSFPNFTLFISNFPAITNNIGRSLQQQPIIFALLIFSMDIHST